MTVKKDRHRPESPKELLKIYDQLHKIPVLPPCDVCPWKLHEDRIQACDNVGCGFMHLYLAQKFYQRSMGYWPYAGEEVSTAKMLIERALSLLKGVDDS